MERDFGLRDLLPATANLVVRCCRTSAFVDDEDLVDEDCETNDQEESDVCWRDDKGIE